MVVRYLEVMRTLRQHRAEKGSSEMERNQQSLITGALCVVGALGVCAIPYHTSVWAHTVFAVLFFVTGSLYSYLQNWIDRETGMASLVPAWACSLPSLGSAEPSQSAVGAAAIVRRSSKRLFDRQVETLRKSTSFGAVGMVALGLAFWGLGSLFTDGQFSAHAPLVATAAGAECLLSLPFLDAIHVFPTLS